MSGNSVPQKTASGLTRTIRPWLIFFLLMCVLALIWSIPASVLPRILSMSNADNVVGVSRTRGTLWSGQAGQVLVNANQQQLVLENVSWRFDWWSLLNAKFCLDISSAPAASTRSGAVSFEGQSCFFTSGAIHLNELYFELPAALLVSARLRDSPLLRTLDSALGIDGEISGVVDNLVWHNRQLQQLSAEGLWSDAAIGMQLPDAQTFRMRRQQLRLGTLPWTAQSQVTDQLFLHVRSAETVAQSATDLQVDSQSEAWLDGRYTTQLQLGLLPSTPAFLRDILTIVAEHQGSGVYRLVWRNTGV